MAALMLKITVSYHKIRGHTKFMSSKTKKGILESELIGQVNLTLPLLLNQNKRVQARAETIMMRINKWIWGGPTFNIASEKICKEIKILLPEMEIFQISRLRIPTASNKNS